MSVGAFTDCTYPYPPYINITRQSDGLYRVTVRSSPTDKGDCGGSAVMDIHINDLVRVLLDAMK